MPWRQNRSKGSNNQLLHNFKSTTDNIDFALSPSDASLPNGKIVGTFLKDWKATKSINDRSVENLIDSHIIIPGLTQFHQSKGSIEVYSNEYNRMPLAEITHSHKSKL